MLNGKFRKDSLIEEFVFPLVFGGTNFLFSGKTLPH